MILTKQIPNDNTKQTAHAFQPRVINLPDIRFTKEQIRTLSLGSNYAIELEPKQFINALIVDIENAI